MIAFEKKEKKKDLQLLICDEIILRTKSKKEAVNQMMDLLKINKSKTYRIFKNESYLKPEEISLLVRHFELSLDELMFGTNRMYHLFSLSPTVLNYDSKESTQILDDFAEMMRRGIKLYYLGSEIPLMHLLRFPELIYFKRFFWKHFRFQSKKSIYPKIDFSKISTEEVKYNIALSELYDRIPSEEIWGFSGLSLILSQIRYCYDLKILNKDSISIMHQSMHKLVSRLEKVMSTGSKSIGTNEDNIMIYSNPIPSASWIYLFLHDEGSFVYGPLDTPNSIFSESLEVIKTVEDRFKGVRQQSILITKTGIVERRSLLKYYRAEIDQLLTLS